MITHRTVEVGLLRLHPPGPARPAARGSCCCTASATGVAFDALVSTLRRNVVDLRSAVPLPGCGHRRQRERSTEVDQAIIDFAGRLDA